MKTILSILSAAAVLTSSLSAHDDAKTFDFDDPKGVNSVSFLLDAPLEQINGTAKGITGTVSFDPDHPEETNGKIVVATDSLTVTNDTMQDHMLGEGWLHADKYPEIVFDAKSVSEVEATDKGFKGQLTGDFTLKGTTQEITVPVEFTHLPDMLGARTNGQAEGDLLVLRSTFTIDRSEYGIKPGESTDKVAEEIELRLAIAGSAPDA